MAGVASTLGGGTLGGSTTGGGTLGGNIVFTGATFSLLGGGIVIQAITRWDVINTFFFRKLLTISSYSAFISLFPSMVPTDINSSLSFTNDVTTSLVFKFKAAYFMILLVSDMGTATAFNVPLSLPLIKSHKGYFITIGMKISPRADNITQAMTF